MEKQDDAVRIEPEDQQKSWIVRAINHKIDGFFKSTEDLLLSNKQALKNVEEFQRRIALRKSDNKPHAKSAKLEEKEKQEKIDKAIYWLKILADTLIKLIAYLTKDKQEGANADATPAKKPQVTPSLEVAYETSANIEFEAAEIVFESDVEFSTTPEFREMTSQEKEHFEGEAARKAQEAVSQWTKGEDKGIPSVGSELPFDQVTPTPPTQSAPQTPAESLRTETPSETRSSAEPFEKPVEPQSSPTQAPPDAQRAPSVAPVSKAPDASPVKKSVGESVDESPEPSSVGTPDSAHADNPPDLAPGNRGVEENSDVPAQSVKPSSEMPSDPVAQDDKPASMETPSQSSPVHDNPPASQQETTRARSTDTKSLKVDDAPMTRFQFTQPESKEKLQLPDAEQVNPRLQFRSIEPLPESVPDSAPQVHDKPRSEVPEAEPEKALGGKKKTRAQFPPPMVIGAVGKRKWLEAPSVTAPSHNRRGDFGVTGDLV